MNKNWTACIITSIVARFFGLAAVLAFVSLMVIHTGSLGCLWLLFLLLAVELIPTYEFKHKAAQKEDTKENKND